MGAQVLDGYYGGEPERVSGRYPKKPVSYAALLERMAGETSWNVEKLRRAVCAEVAARTLDEGIANRISVTLLWRLYSVDNLAVRKGLAARIASRKLRGKAAWAAIAKETVRERHGGREPRAEALRVISRVKKILTEAKAKHQFDRRRLGALEGEAEQELRAAVAACREVLDEVEGILDA